MFDTILKIFILFSTLLHLGFMPQNIFDVFYFQIAALSIIGTALCSNPVREFKLSKFVLIPIFLNVIQIFLYCFNPYNFQYFICFNLGLGILYCIVKYCKNPDSLIKYILFGALINFIYMTLQYIAISNRFIKLFHYLQSYIQVEVHENGIINFGGILGNQVRAMYLFSICIPLFLYYGKKWFFITGIMFSASGFIYFPEDYQFNCLIIFIITSLFLIPKYIPKLKLSRNEIIYSILTLIIMTLIYLFIFERETFDGSITARYNIWTKIINDFFTVTDKVKFFPEKIVILIRIIFGNGIDISCDFIRDPNYDWTCLNSYLYFIFGFGIGGIIFIGYCLYTFFKNFKVSPVCLSILSILILALFEYIFEIRRNHLDIFTIFSIFIIKGKYYG